MIGMLGRKLYQSLAPPVFTNSKTNHQKYLIFLHSPQFSHCEPVTASHCEVAEGNRGNLQRIQGKLCEAISREIKGLLRRRCLLAMTFHKLSNRTP